MIVTTIRITKDLVSMIDKVIEKTGVTGRSTHIRRAIYDYCRRLLDEKKGEWNVRICNCICSDYLVARKTSPFMAGKRNIRLELISKDWKSAAQPIYQSRLANRQGLEPRTRVLETHILPIKLSTHWCDEHLESNQGHQRTLLRGNWILTAELYSSGYDYTIARKTSPFIHLDFAIEYVAQYHQTLLF